MDVLSFESATDFVQGAVKHVERTAERAIQLRGRFTFGVSGGKSPRAFFESLGRSSLDFSKTELFQVDERLLPLGNPDRNRTLVETYLLSHLSLKPLVHWMPVELPPEEAIASYETTLRAALGDRPRLDLVHLGLGADGHTASLLPGDDPVLNNEENWVALTRNYQGTRRLTLTYPMLSAAQNLLWYVAGQDKREALEQLRSGDPHIPASRLREVPSTVFAFLGPS
jgi:6-phosphogluconolactonase